ncbi:hypothetical protein [Kitasatospora terrestris]|uniref:Uncharacterized protein n=1 Tax=Kitasatospora terrestris TaxID=258051 RepID=A0ABP9DAD1_9ACTN
MLLTIDTHSTAYLNGRIVGQIIVLAAGIALAWVLTRKWRNPVALMPADLPRVTVARKRRRLLLVLITAAACALSATELILDLRRESPYGAAASTGPTDRTVDAPDTVAGYHLITGEAAARLIAKRPARTGEHLWYYSTTPGATEPNLIFTASTNAWDPAGAAEKAKHSLDQLFTDFFAGAKVEDAEDVDPGPLGGLMRCGHSQNGNFVICRWEDAGAAGTVVAADATGIQEAGALALQFRNAAEHSGARSS